jgi:hypothetical protein
MTALRLVMRRTPTASAMVMIVGRPSGTTDNSIPMTAWNSSTRSMSFYPLTIGEYHDAHRGDGA